MSDEQTIKINAEDKALWAAALDSGEYQQAAQTLFDGTGYCCLGVLAKVKGCHFFHATTTEIDDDGTETEVESDGYDVITSDCDNINDNELLNQNFADKAGITNAHQGFLSHLNDGGHISLMPSAPMFPVCQALGFEYMPSQQLPGATTFTIPKHSFAEISKVIKDHF